MKIAVPVADGQLAMHFGHCDAFALIDADQESGEIRSVEESASPPHQPGVLPKWLGEQGVEVVIAGGMGQRAQRLFADQHIRVVVGAPAEPPEALVKLFLQGNLETGDNICDH